MCINWEISELASLLLIKLWSFRFLIIITATLGILRHRSSMLASLNKTECQISCYWATTKRLAGDSNSVYKICDYKVRNLLLFAWFLGFTNLVYEPWVTLYLQHAWSTNQSITTKLIQTRAKIQTQNKINPRVSFLIGCHFSQDHAIVTKILDFIHKHPCLLQWSIFFCYLYWFSEI